MILRIGRVVKPYLLFEVDSDGSEGLSEAARLR
jgi:hypothetical protein